MQFSVIRCMDLFHRLSLVSKLRPMYIFFGLFIKTHIFERNVVPLFLYIFVLAAATVVQLNKR